MGTRELSLQLGVGTVTWTMPSLVHRLEVLQRQYVDGVATAQMYALLAGLPVTVLNKVDLSGKPGLDLENADRLLERQGCNIVHVQKASAQAWRSVIEWYTESMPKTDDAQGNEEAVALDSTG